MWFTDVQVRYAGCSAVPMNVVVIINFFLFQFEFYDALCTAPLRVSYFGK